MKNISFAYQGAGGLVLSDVSVNLSEGECLVVMGPSGSGKTTLLRLFAGELSPCGGEILLSERVYLTPESLVSQKFRTVLENALLVSELRRPVTKEHLNLAVEVLGRVGLGRDLSARPDELSRGMAARLSFVQTLLSGSKLLLLDEPFASLDVRTRRICERVFLDFRRRLGFTTVLVTHDFGTAVNCGDRVLLISGSPMLRSTIVEKSQLASGSLQGRTEKESNVASLKSQKALFEHYQRLCEIDK